MNVTTQTPILQLVPHFLTYAKVQQGWSQTTIKQYGSRTRMFCRWLTEGATASDFSRTILNRYIYHLSASEWNGTPITATTVRSHFAALRAFGAWLIEVRLLDADSANPANLIKLPKKSAPEVTRIDDFVARDLLTAADNVRDQRRSLLARAIMSVFLHTGIRRGELLALTVENVNLRSRLLYVVHGKGDKNREIPLFEETAQALRDWLSVRGRQSVKSLFVMYSNSGLGVVGLKSIIDELAAISGHRNVPIKCHAFRHNACQWLHNEKGLSLRECQEILGHESSETTSKYLSASVTSIKKKVDAMTGRTQALKRRMATPVKRFKRVAL